VGRQVSGEDRTAEALLELAPVPPTVNLAGVLVQLAEHAESIARLEGTVDALTETAADLRALVEGDEGGGIPYRPIPAPRWWLLTGDERQAATDRLAAWVEQVYRPGYGHLAARLPPCWREHSFCLYMLDWLSELHSVLYLKPRRTGGDLASQAEWQSRLLPAAAEAMAAEAQACGHQRGRP